MAVTKFHVIVLLSITLVLLIGSRLYFDRETYMTLYKNQLEISASRDAMTLNSLNLGQGQGQSQGQTASDRDEMLRLTEELIEQRNNLSRQLNLKQQKIGQMECEKNLAKGKKTKTGQDTSLTGGWCMNASKEGAGHHKTDKKLVPVLADFFKGKKSSKGGGVSSTGGWCSTVSGENSGQHKTDTKLVPVLAEFLKGKYVASFGDGPGRYKQLLLDSGKLKGYDAYDGAPFTEKTSEGRVKFLDLTLPQYGLPLYDWVMSLEVAEHIPKEYESIYINNVVRHAKEGVVLSWAKLGQQGYSHVNNRPFSYVKALFEKLGFEHDEVSSKLLQKSAKLEWLQWNTNVYRRKDLSKIEQLRSFQT